MQLQFQRKLLGRFTSSECAHDLLLCYVFVKKNYRGNGKKQLEAAAAAAAILIVIKSQSPSLFMAQKES